jgi:tetratricopeptide (TPR) repeat protein
MRHSFRVVLFVLLPIAGAFGGEHVTTQTDSIVHHGIRQTFLCDFDSAMLTFQKLRDCNLDDLAGPFYLAATLQSKMMDAETNAWEAEFYEYIDKVIREAEEKIAAGRGDPQIYMYLGSAYNYKGLYEGKQGRLVKGFIHAHKGIRYLEKALKIDSTLIDACVGVGNYKYWSGHFYKYLKWLPWISDERELGILLVQKAITRGTYSRWVGVSSMGWIEFDRKNYKEGIKLFDSGLREFPGSRFFLWGAADCAFGMKDFELAIQLYSQLLSSICRSAGQSGYNEAECRYKMLKAHEALEQFDKAVLEANAILALKPPEAVEIRIKKHRKAAKECIKRCMERIKKKSANE